MLTILAFIGRRIWTGNKLLRLPLSKQQNGQSKWKGKCGQKSSNSFHVVKECKKVQFRNKGEVSNF